jgi:choline kinase/phosphatidylglycerophosphate synthase
MQPQQPAAPHQSVICAVVVAAESAHRTGSSPPTVLRRVGGVSLLRRTVRVLCDAGVVRIVVVAGHRSEAVAAAIVNHDLPVELVVNSDWQRGTSTSVVLGLERVEDTRCLVVMGDHVFESEDVRRLLGSPGPNVLAVDRDPRRHVGGLTGVPPARVRTTSEGRVLELAPDLADNGAVDAGLSAIQVADVLRVAAAVPPSSWVELRQRMVDAGVEMTTCEVVGLWAAVDTPEGVGALERAMWRRYGPKPTDQIIARTVNRRISGPLTRLLLRTGLSPDVATLLAFATTLVAAALIAVGQWWAMTAGGLGVMLGSALDGVDGELARVSGRASRRGAALDTLLDRYADLAVVVGLVLGAGAAPGDWAWGFAAGCGCLLISYVHAVGRDTDVRLLFRREVRLLIFALAAVVGQPLAGLVVVAIAANLDTARGVVLLLRAMRT